MMFGSYRTGVTNDFSIVSKAMFTIIEYDPLNPAISYKLKDKLPVQINPDKFSYSSKNEITRLSGISKKREQYNIMIPSNEKSTSIELKYDIYDEYIIATSDGLIPKPFSLFDEKLTSLPKLIKYASRSDEFGDENKIIYAYFTWGDIEYFGQLREVSCEYTAFSRWGEPLKCNASVSMELESMPKGMDFKAIRTGITGYMAASKVANIATLAATQALR